MHASESLTPSLEKHTRKKGNRKRKSNPPESTKVQYLRLISFIFTVGYPLSCQDIQSRLKCPALTHLSNRDRKTSGSYSAQNTSKSVLLSMAVMEARASV